MDYVVSGVRKFTFFEVDEYYGEFLCSCLKDVYQDVAVGLVLTKDDRDHFSFETFLRRTYDSYYDASQRIG